MKKLVGVCISVFGLFCMILVIIFISNLISLLIRVSFSVIWVFFMNRLVYCFIGLGIWCSISVIRKNSVVKVVVVFSSYSVRVLVFCGFLLGSWGGGGGVEVVIGGFRCGKWLRIVEERF